MMIRIRRRRSGRAPIAFSETIYGDAADGYIESSGAASGYAACRNGTATTLTADTVAVNGGVGQEFYGGSNYLIDEIFFGFDVTTFRAAYPTAIISTITLGVYANGAGVNGHIFEARLFDWGAGLTSVDFVPGADLGGKTLLGSFTNDAVAGAKTFTGAGFATNLPSTGFYRMVIVAANTTNNVAPTTTEAIGLGLQEHATQANRPRIVITGTY